VEGHDEVSARVVGLRVFRYSGSGYEVGGLGVWNWGTSGLGLRVSDCAFRI
jgi:hypothetical protein